MPTPWGINRGPCQKPFGERKARTADTGTSLECTTLGKRSQAPKAARWATALLRRSRKGGTVGVEPNQHCQEPGGGAATARQRGAAAGRAHAPRPGVTHRVLIGAPWLLPRPFSGDPTSSTASGQMCLLGPTCTVFWVHAHQKHAHPQADRTMQTPR